MQASPRIRLPECICDAPDMHKESGAAPLRAVPLFMVC